MNENEEFYEALYEDVENEMKEVYKRQKETQDDLLKDIAILIITYKVVDAVLDMNKKEQSKEQVYFSKILTKFAKEEAETVERKIKDVLTSSIEKVSDHYNYNINRKDVLKIVNEAFKGRIFSERVWDNQQKVVNLMQKTINDFLKGDINISQIKNIIEKQFNNSIFQIDRLVNTEVSRAVNEAFDAMCKATEVKKVKYNSVLEENTCPVCESRHGNIYKIENKPEIPQHPSCKCFFEVLE